MNNELEILFALKGKLYRGRIEEWAIDNWNTTDHTQHTRYVSGNLYDRQDYEYIPQNDNGTYIRTSLIVEIYENETILETKNSYYKLGARAHKILF